MSQTMLSDLINPKVISDMISAELEKKLILTGYYKVDRSLTGRAGDTIIIPSYSYIGAAIELAEGECIDESKLTTNESEYTIKKIAKRVNLTDEAVTHGYGDPAGEAVRQIRLALQDKIEQDGADLLNNITTSMPTTGNIYNDVIIATAKFNQEELPQMYLFVNNNTFAKIVSTADSMINAVGVTDAKVSGRIYTIGGAQVVVSNRIADKKYILTRDKVLTAFIKKDIAVETARNITCFSTDIVGSTWYTVAIEDYTKIIVLEDA